MLPPKGRSSGTVIVVGPANSDPYVNHAGAIRALGDHFGMTLDRAHCYPYRR
jgi:citrate synthase